MIYSYHFNPDQKLGFLTLSGSFACFVIDGSDGGGAETGIWGLIGAC